MTHKEAVARDKTFVKQSIMGFRVYIDLDVFVKNSFKWKREESCSIMPGKGPGLLG